MRDLFAHKELGVYKKSFTARVNPSGVVMVKLIPICDEGKTDKKTNNKEKKIADSKTDEKEIEKTDKNKALKIGEKEDHKRCQCVKLNWPTRKLNYDFSQSCLNALLNKISE